MFRWCESLKELDLSGFDTSRVTDMAAMFCTCSKLTSLDLSSFDTSNVTTMAWMFCECTSPLELDLSSWDVSNVGNMYQMFFKFSWVGSVDISGWDVSNVNNYELFMDGGRTINGQPWEELFSASAARKLIAGELTDGTPVGEAQAADEGTYVSGDGTLWYVTKGDVAVTSLTEQELDNGYYRYTVKFSVPGIYPVSVFAPPQSVAFAICSARDTSGGEDTLIFDMKMEKVKKAESINISFDANAWIIIRRAK